ncbi:hypothetical protein CYY_005833 [Polysphondylium violaceum]|uniref:EGF-like domain-containing protein n=1 Tax=Polysphondylium violaceum TaxID=133409 RepID=A0A8J4URW9_9MYCE|nr:hypothetical protein CYY_005833 [Polysphondylium violaceum]
MFGGVKGQLRYAVVLTPDSYTTVGGSCAFEFLYYLQFQGGAGANIIGCDVSATPAPSTTTCNLLSVNANTTNQIFYVRATLPPPSGNTVTPYKDLKFQAKISPSGQVEYPMLKQDSSAITFICAEPPLIPVWLASSIPMKFVSSSYLVATNRLEGYITVTSEFTRSLIGVLKGPSTGLQCNFKYLKGQKYKVMCSTITGYASPYPLKIPLTIGSYTQNIDNPIAITPYKEFVYPTLPTLSYFNNLPYMGNVFEFQRNDLIPSLDMAYVPTESKASSLYMYFKSDDPITPKYLSQASFTTLGSTTTKPVFSNLVPSYTIYITSPEQYVIATVQTISTRIWFQQDYTNRRIYFSYPFGVYSVAADGKRNIKFPIVQNSRVGTVLAQFGLPYPVYHKIILPPATESTPAVLNAYNIISLNETTSVLTMSIADVESGLYFASINTSLTTYFVTGNDRVVGTELDGTYEIYVSFKRATPFNVTLVDNSRNIKVLSYDYMNARFGTAYPDTAIIDKIILFNFDQTSVDVTSSSAAVLLEVKITQTADQRDQDNSFLLRIFFSALREPLDVIGIYDNVLGSYKFPFAVPSKLMATSLRYSLFFNHQEMTCDDLYDSLGDPAVLKVINTGTFDMMFPIVDNLVQPTSAITITNQDIDLLWTFTVSDQSGLKVIYVTIASDYDMQGQNFTFTPVFPSTLSQTINAKVTVSPTKCRSMSYFISYMYTEDILGNKGEYIRNTNNGLHPLYKQDNSALISPAVTCPLAPDTLNPTITGVTITDISETFQKIIRVRITATDSGSGLSRDHLPICYFSASGNQLLASQTTVKSFSNDNLSAEFDCLFDSIPFRFGPYMVLSIYGLTDNYFNTIGYDPNDIKAIPNALNNWNLVNLAVPMITSTNSLAKSSKKLIVSGYNYGLSPSTNSCIIEIGYDRPQGPAPSTLTPVIYLKNTLVALDLIPAWGYSINVKDTYSNAKSNVITLVGPLANPSTDSSASSTHSSASSTDSAGSTTTPTTPPTCNSDCGAPQGYGTCVNGKCVCNSPHNGLDCKASIDTTTVISPNTNNPSVNISIPGSNSATTPEFTSFVSVVEMRELDLSNNVVVKSHQFDNNLWQIVKENSESNDRVTTLQYKYTIVSDDKNTILTSTIQVFSQATNITFGNQKLFMNPSTIKFTFNITAYPFTKSTNVLQLVMIAQLESSEKVACSYKEFVDDQSGDSQYLKIQIQDRSLFGRFIKFGLIDGRERILTNVQLDSTYSTSTQSQPTYDQSFIGLNIPYYTQQAVIDPDFSVLIEQKSARDQENSICSASKKKLTNAQIAGIVIGCIVFVFIVAAVVIFLLSRGGHSKIAIKLKKVIHR